jgi:hypothetical protein
MAGAQQEDLTLLRDKIMLYYQYCIDKGMPASYFEEPKRLVDSAYMDGKVSVLRSGSRDVDMHIREMSLQQAIELKNIFEVQLNIDYTVMDQEGIKAINKIINKGTIATEEEYRLIRDRTNEIYADTDKQNEMRKLNDLLIKYDEKILNGKS